MKPLKMNRTFWRIFLFCLMSISSPAFGDETYEFERMWPIIQQGWNFSDVKGIAIDSNGNVYIADGSGNSVRKFSSNGEFITKFGNFTDIQGIETDQKGNIYVVDDNCNCIQKFNSDGQLIVKWGKSGKKDGEFDSPRDIAIDLNGNIYVSDTDNNRIQKFGADGEFILSWGKEGTGDGEFGSVEGVAADSDGNIYVADNDNNCIQKFTSKGEFISKWGIGRGNKKFISPHGIAIDRYGNIYVADTFAVSKFTSDGTFISELGENNGGIDGDITFPDEIAADKDGNVYVSDSYKSRVQKFNKDGIFLSKWGSSGSDTGKFSKPLGITTDTIGYIYIADSDNHRIQKFDSKGNFITAWGSRGYGSGEFESPWGVVADKNNNIYVADTCNYRIQKFTSNGVFIKKWSTFSISEGSITIISGNSRGFAIDTDDNIYITDSQNTGIKKFTSDGVLLSSWGKEGSGNGEFESFAGIAVDKYNNIYVADSGNNRIQKFDSDGNFIAKWDVSIQITQSGGGITYSGGISGIAVDKYGNFFVSDHHFSFIQKFTSAGELITKFGGSGYDPGFFKEIQGLYVDQNDRVYISDTGNNRIQVFKEKGNLSDDTSDDNKQRYSKAIIVAGGGPFPGNTLWDATRMCANYAYRALTYQGYTKDRIYYLSADTNLDLDGNGIADDVDADAINKNLQKAITEWAKDAEDLLIYMADHGGEGTFRMSASELLYAEQLNSWLDTAQDSIPGTVTLIYDACRSGSFIKHLSGKKRIIAASSDFNQESVFADQGTLSFSFIFWARIFNGDSFYDAFVHAKNSVGLLYPQTSQLDADGNGIANEKNDQELARKNRIGNETKTAGDIPFIGHISPIQTLAAQKSALIYAENVVDSDGINKVWAVITPPNYINYSVITNLPTIELAKVGDNRYEAVYNGFTAKGTYNITVFAMDRHNGISLPSQTSVTQLSGNSCIFVSDDLAFNICAEYHAVKYGFTLMLDNAAQLSWKADLGTFRVLQSDPGSCISVRDDLKLDICAEYQGHNFGFTMNYDKDAMWKMDVGTFREIH